jgi:hypothetical protein
VIDPELAHDLAAPITNKTLRQFAGLWILFFVGLAVWQGFGRERWFLAYVLAGLGLVVGLMGLARPSAMQPIFRGSIKITYPIGWLVSNILLSLFFYIVFTPLGLLFKVVGRDVLQLRQPPGRESYLTPKPAAAGMQSYFRQS